MPVKAKKPLTPRTLARRAATFASDKQALDILVLDLRKVTDFTDYFVICSGAVDVHVKAIYEHIKDEFRNMGYRAEHIEGEENMRWILIDYIDVVIHVFQADVRSYYSIERLWGDASEVKIKGVNA